MPPLLGEGGFRNGFLFLDGDSLCVPKESLRDHPTAKSHPRFVRENPGDDAHLRKLVVRERTPELPIWHQNATPPPLLAALPLRAVSHCYPTFEIVTDPRYAGVVARSTSLLR